MLLNSAAGSYCQLSFSFITTSCIQPDYSSEDSINLRVPDIVRKLLSWYSWVG
jgi:hypothetical protein